eukprot:5673760-Amphidinium_carterae.1
MGELGTGICYFTLYAHIQRSEISLHSADENVLSAFCKKGKSRVAATRRGFHWFLPKRGITKVDLSAPTIQGPPLRALSCSSLSGQA